MSSSGIGAAASRHGKRELAPVEPVSCGMQESSGRYYYICISISIMLIIIITIVSSMIMIVIMCIYIYIYHVMISIIRSLRAVA